MTKCSCQKPQTELDIFRQLNDSGMFESSIKSIVTKYESHVIEFCLVNFNKINNYVKLKNFYCRQNNYIYGIYFLRHRKERGSRKDQNLQIIQEVIFFYL